MYRDVARISLDVDNEIFKLLILEIGSICKHTEGGMFARLDRMYEYVSATLADYDLTDEALEMLACTIGTSTEANGLSLLGRRHREDLVDADLGAQLLGTVLYYGRSARGILNFVRRLELNQTSCSRGFGRLWMQVETDVQMVEDSLLTRIPAEDIDMILSPARLAMLRRIHAELKLDDFIAPDKEFNGFHYFLGRAEEIISRLAVVGAVNGVMASELVKVYPTPLDKLRAHWSLFDFYLEHFLKRYSLTPATVYEFLKSPAATACYDNKRLLRLLRKHP